MEHVAALLLVLGCSDGSADCQMLQDRLPRYESVQDCEREMSAEMNNFADQSELVIARCVFVDPIHDQGWRLNWMVTDEGWIEASAEPVNFGPSVPLTWI